MLGKLSFHVDILFQPGNVHFPIIFSDLHNKLCYLICTVTSHCRKAVALELASFHGSFIKNIVVDSLFFVLFESLAQKSTFQGKRIQINWVERGHFFQRNGIYYESKGGTRKISPSSRVECQVI